MKRSALALVAFVVSASALAQVSDTAQVVSVTPIMDRVNTPRQECWTEQVSGPAHQPHSGRSIEYVQSPRAAGPQAGSSTSGAGAVLGAIIGGVVGHQFGNSTGGKDRGTIAGAVVGGLVGNAIESSSASPSAPAPAYGRDVQPSVYSPSSETRTVERCRTVHDTREKVNGYNVTYRYGNQQFTSRMPYDPGATLRVRVSVTPEITR
jgi:uncharacterized protein YcfJ